MTIRIHEQFNDMSIIEAIQKEIWGGPDVVPGHMLTAVLRNGGMLLAAEVGGEITGFTFSFPAPTNIPGANGWKHQSHMLAVLPQFRGQGVGYALKQAQWEMAHRQGISLITWTYDPLLSENAHLNIRRLGAVCNTYIRDYYGEMNDTLNAGVASDRLQVDLWVESPRVARGRSAKREMNSLQQYFALGAEVVNPLRFQTDEQDRPWPVPPEATWVGSSIATLVGGAPPPDSPLPLLLEIPADFYALKATQPELARTWRAHIRALLEDHFARGYQIVDFVYETGEVSRGFYVLEKPRV